MSDITIPVSAPGATAAAKELSSAANSAENLAKQTKLLTSLNEHFAKSNNGVAQSEKDISRAIQQAADKMSQSAKAHHVEIAKTSEKLRQARREAAEYNGEVNKASGHGGGGALYMASRAFPGHEMQILNAGRMISGAGAGVGMALIPLAAAAATAAVAIKYDADLVAEHNKVAMEGLKIDQELNRVRYESKIAMQTTAATDAKGVRKAARTILNLDPQGEKAVKDLIGMGAGSEGIAAMASLLKNRGNRFGHGMTAWTAFDMLSEAKKVSSDTGMEIPDVLNAMASGKGIYNRTRFEREQMGRTYSPGMRATFKESAETSDTSLLLDKVERGVRSEAKVSMGRAFDPDMVDAGLRRQYIQLTDPVALAIIENNRKINEQMEIQQQLVDAEKTMVTVMWEHIAALDPSNRILHTAARDAAREKTTLSRGKR